MAAPSARLLVEQRRSWFRRPAVVFVAAAVGVFAVVGGITWLVRGDNTRPSTDPTVPTTSARAPEVDGEGLRWELVPGAPDLETVLALVPDCCQNIALGADEWISGFGESFTGPGAQPIPPEIGTVRSMVTNGVQEVIAVPAVGPSTAPYVAARQIAQAGPAPGMWTTEALPTDVPSPHLDVVMHYTVQSVAHSQSGHSFAVYGWAQAEVDPASIVREYPGLEPVVRTDLLPPCCDGEPLTTEIADPLWVWTGSPSSEPTAISLATIGLTREDLHGTTGVVWVVNRSSGSAPWVTTTALVVDHVGPESFLEAGKSGGFVLLTGHGSDRYDTWTSPTGATWAKVEATPAEVVDVAVWRGRALVLTAHGTILGLQQNNTWDTFADASTFDLPDGKTADPVRIETGDIGVVVVGEREEELPWSDGEPIPTAQVLWFSPDGSTWRHQELADIFGDIGAIEILVTRHEGHRDVPPTVIAAFGVGQANGEPVTDPQWWAARTD